MHIPIGVLVVLYMPGSRRMTTPPTPIAARLYLHASSFYQNFDCPAPRLGPIHPSSPVNLRMFRLFGHMLNQSDSPSNVQDRTLLRYGL